MDTTRNTNHLIRMLLCTGLGAGLCLLAGCESIVNSVQGAPVREIFPGQAVGSSLDVSVHAVVEVSSTRTLSGITSAKNYNNPYIRNVRGGSPVFRDVQTSRVVGHTYSSTTEIWKINTEYLTAPTEYALIVSGDGFFPRAILFAGVSECVIGKIRDTQGIELPAYSATHNTVAGAYKLDPKESYCIAVQGADMTQGAVYQLAVRN